MASPQAIRDQIDQSMAVKVALREDDRLLAQVEVVINACLDALRQGRKVIFAGNGGSFADAQHLSAEFVSRFMFDRAPLASMVLGANSSAISAIGNDYGYEHVFSRELEAVGQAGDVFVGISTSGNSPNVLAAVDSAAKLGIRTFALTGATGGKLNAVCECLRMPSSETPRIQECHILIGHIICERVEAIYFAGPDGQHPR